MTAAMLVLELRSRPSTREYAYRPGRNAQQAVVLQAIPPHSRRLRRFATTLLLQFNLHRAAL
jgi:hypothetical protein